jgi:hypothetical protein
MFPVGRNRRRGFPTHSGLCNEPLCGISGLRGACLWPQKFRFPGHAEEVQRSNSGVLVAKFCYAQMRFAFSISAVSTCALIARFESACCCLSLVISTIDQLIDLLKRLRELVAIQYLAAGQLTALHFARSPG